MIKPWKLAKSSLINQKINTDDLKALQFSICQSCTVNAPRDSIKYKSK